LPILSAVAPFKAGGRSGPEYYTDFASGPMRQRHAADLYLHPNTLVGFRITGAELALWLERSVSLFAQIAPSAKDADLINPDFPSFNFDVVFGVTYQVDLTKAAQFDARGVQVNPNARRIVNLRYKGQPVRDDQRFVLASNSYRRDTHIGFFGASEANVVCAADMRIQAILRAYIMAQKPFPVHQPAHWGFLPLDGATVQLRTSPKASEVLGDIAHLRPHPLGLDATGFQRFRLHL
jgi:2',3'-cyclic-nucleotide 2'-phosphodiesterase/3'-nucleotidase